MKTRIYYLLNIDFALLVGKTKIEKGFKALYSELPQTDTRTQLPARTKIFSIQFGTLEFKFQKLNCKLKKAKP